MSGAGSEPKTLALTAGDPCGIGPEVLMKALFSIVSEPAIRDIKYRIYGSESSFQASDARLFESLRSLPNITWQLGSEKFALAQGCSAGGQAALKDLEASARFVIDLPENRALVTGPVDKFFIAQYQKDFTGQTGFLRQLSPSKRAIMMLAGPQIRVSLVTTHLAISQVSKALNQESIVQTCDESIAYLRKLRLNHKIRVAVCALNPHASDKGLFGSEEADIIFPACEKLRRKYDVEIVGPLPADTLFVKYKDFDLIIAMYHDQALIPLKLLDFESAINISLGLGFFRSSVDHGTAFDIAGQNKASFLSYKNAIIEAIAYLG